MRNNRQVLKFSKKNSEESQVGEETDSSQTEGESRSKQKSRTKKNNKGGTQTCTRNLKADSLIEEISLPTSLGLTLATVASKAMIE